MRAHLTVAFISLMCAGSAAGAEMPVPDTAAMQLDAMKLCERLAGTEREICVKQARENQKMADPAGLGATPGAPGGGAAQVPRPERDAGPK